MEIMSMLNDLGLTKYEASAYVSLLNLGVCEARSICKDADIPMGKIYETLGVLKAKGLIEAQNVRPRKFMAKKPKAAFQRLYSLKKEEQETELSKVKATIKKLEKEVKPKITEMKGENIFWTTTIGPEGIAKSMNAVFDEAEEEMLMVLHDKTRHKDCPIDKTIKMVFESSLNALARGVKLKLIDPGCMVVDFLKANTDVIMQQPDILKNFELRHLRSDAAYVIVDRSIIVIDVLDPINPNELFAMVKIYDDDQCERLTKNFHKLWRKAEKVKLF